MNSDTVQKYLFDLNGYLILEDVLSADEVARLNSLIDEQGLPQPGLKTSEARFGSSTPELGGKSRQVSWNGARSSASCSTTIV